MYLWKARIHYAQSLPDFINIWQVLTFQKNRVHYIKKKKKKYNFKDKSVQIYKQEQPTQKEQKGTHIKCVNPFLIYQ